MVFVHSYGKSIYAFPKHETVLCLNEETNVVENVKTKSFHQDQLCPTQMAY